MKASEKMDPSQQQRSTQKTEGNGRRLVNEKWAKPLVGCAVK